MVNTGFGSEYVGRSGIHVTDISQFRECRFRWNIQSHLRRNLESKKFTAPLWLGTGIHEALAAYYGEGLDVVEAFSDWAITGKAALKKVRENISEEEIAKIDEQIDLGTGMLTHYKEWAPLHDDFEVVAVEQLFRIPDFVQGEPLEGRGDGIIRRGGRLWIIEHKTAIAIITERLLLEEQPGSYQIGMQSRYDEPIVGTFYNFLRKKIPTEPKVLKNGELSVAKNMDTTASVYEAAIKENDLNPDDYVEHVEYLRQKEKEKPYFYREEVVRSNKNLEILWSNMQATAKEMLDPSTLIYPSPSPLKCQMCNVQAPCIAYCDGQDYDFILGETMMERQEEYALESEEVAPEWVL